MTRPITEDERGLVEHIIRWGSDGYPINRLGRGRSWSWGPFRSVKGPPTTFKRKRDAVASFEAFLGVLHAALSEEAKARAEAEQEARRVRELGEFLRRGMGAQASVDKILGCTCGGERRALDCLPTCATKGGGR